MTKKVVIYTRVSTLDQTIDNQLIELRDHCSKMGWEVVKEYADEGLSGTLSREKRPALNSLIKDAYVSSVTVSPPVQGVLHSKYP